MTMVLIVDKSFDFFSNEDDWRPGVDEYDDEVEGNVKHSNDDNDGVDGKDNEADGDDNDGNSDDDGNDNAGDGNKYVEWS